ncbi:MAG TPA: 4'-phosphopantetheinyl transferase superfamily protein [Candidatus Sulfotelmatobacter sp.]|nr:4'-phosphopantetheinyl transferase superfamily protein [Candidatus Sulfotelmatobacter sp.]
MNQKKRSGSEFPAVSVVTLSVDSLLVPMPPELEVGEVHVWEFPLRISGSALAALEKCLSKDEQVRMRRFHAQRDGQRFAAAHGMLRSILAAYTGCPRSQLEFITSEFGKPRLAGSNSALRFNLSHSRERALLGVRRDREIGVDIEAIKQDVECEKLAKRFFSDREQETLLQMNGEAQIRAFFRCWTCKEAFLKAQAVGLSRSLESFDIDLQSERVRLAATRPDAGEAERWSIVEINAAPGYASAICVEGRAETIRLFQYD